MDTNICCVYGGSIFTTDTFRKKEEKRTGDNAGKPENRR